MNVSAFSNRYIQHYPLTLQQQVEQLWNQQQLNAYLQARYQTPHNYTTDKALYHYIQHLKNTHLKSAPPIAKALYDSKLDVIHHALGLHTSYARVQGNKLKVKKEIRISHLFKQADSAFLNMIVVHELAHLRESAHNKSFYQLCEFMMPNYHQVEFDFRVYLTAQLQHT